RARVPSHDGRDARGVHLLDLGVAAFRGRLRIAKHRLEHGAVQGFDASSGVDLFYRELGAETSLLAGIGQCARDRMEHAHLDGQAWRRRDCRGIRSARRSDGAESGGLQETAAADGRNRTRHGALLMAGKRVTSVSSTFYTVALSSPLWCPWT